MKRTLRYVLAALIAGGSLAGCSDRTTSPVEVRPAGPHLNTQVDTAAAAKPQPPTGETTTSECCDGGGVLGSGCKNPCPTGS